MSTDKNLKKKEFAIRVFWRWEGEKKWYPNGLMWAGNRKDLLISLATQSIQNFLEGDERIGGGKTWRKEYVAKWVSIPKARKAATRSFTLKDLKKKVTKTVKEEVEYSLKVRP